MRSQEGPQRRRNRRWIAALAAFAALAAAGWGQAKKTGEEIEGQIKQSAFKYYFGTVFGDAGEYMQAARMPLHVVHDGVVTVRDEKAARALLAAIAGKVKAAHLSDEERKRIATNMIGLIDQAGVQFIGANTATLALPVSPAAKPGDPESLIELVLHRKEGRWQVIAEISDSAPIPPEYVK
jgi:hypothetical protein